MMHMLANIVIKPSENYLTSTLIPFFSDFVLLFMMVSGFSLCCGYYERIKCSLISPNDFYKRRYSRILPFFALLCGLNLVLDFSLDTFYQVYANVTLCFNLLPQHDIDVVGVGWFLGIVFLFYLLFPFFVFMLDNKRRAWLSLVLAIIFLFIAFERFGSPNRSNIIFDAPYFLIGGIAYLYRDKLVSFGRKFKYIYALFTICFTVFYFGTKGIVESKHMKYLLELSMFTIWLIYAIGSHDIILNNRAVKYLSGISMEIYLCHMVIFRIVEKMHIERFIDNRNVLYVLTFILVICGTICFSHIVKYYLFPYFSSITARCKLVKNKIL